MMKRGEDDDDDDDDEEDDTRECGDGEEDGGRWAPPRDDQV